MSSATRQPPQTLLDCSRVEREFVMRLRRAAAHIASEAVRLQPADPEQFIGQAVDDFAVKLAFENPELELLTQACLLEHIWRLRLH